MLLVICLIVLKRKRKKNIKMGQYKGGKDLGGVKGRKSVIRYIAWKIFLNKLPVQLEEDSR